MSNVLISVGIYQLITLLSPEFFDSLPQATRVTVVAVVMSQRYTQKLKFFSIKTRHNTSPPKPSI